MPPLAMTDLKQWVNYAIEDRINPTTGEITSTKVPYQCGTWRLARSNDPATWGTWAQAAGRPPGFMFDYHTGIMGIDLDHCIREEDGALSHIAQEVLRLCHTYTEISPSGDGLHLFGYGTLPQHQGRREDRLGLEMYDSKRYFTVTENSYHDPSLPLGNIQPGVEYLLRKYFPVPQIVTCYPATPALDDAEVIRKVLASVKYRELWYGGLGECPTGSHADASLLGYLKWLCNSDRAQMRRVYEQSPRCTRTKDKPIPKWYEKRRGTTYGEITLDFVLQR